jgi:SlyX protein
MPRFRFYSLFVFNTDRKNMDDKILEKRLVDIEINLTNQEKMLDELSDIIAEQSKTIDYLKKQNEMLVRALQENVVKPQNEETPPPHY